MARKLVDIESKESAELFLTYLKNKISGEAYAFLERLSVLGKVHIFSGVIRDYFLGYSGAVRDIDLVVSSMDEDFLERYLWPYDFDKNSFGGYKVELPSLKIDIWHINNTWAYAKNKIDTGLFDFYDLPNTAFFNFSSIVFDFSSQQFIYGIPFKKFLQTKELDLVLEANPLPALCIVNTLYYKRKFRLAISNNLRAYCLNHFAAYNEEDFDKTQLKHFGNILFPYPYIKEYMKVFNKSLNAKVSKEVSA